MVDLVSTIYVLNLGLISHARRIRGEDVDGRDRPDQDACGSGEGLREARDDVLELGGVGVRQVLG